MNPWLTNNYPNHRDRLSLSPSTVMAGIRLLESRGTSMQALQQRWNFPLSALRQPYLRLPAFLSRHFWECARALDDDPAIGVAAARPADLGQLLGLNYLMQLAPTRLEALHMMQRFWPLVASHLQLHFDQQPGTLRFELQAPAKLRPAVEEVDYWCARQIHHLRSWICAPNPIIEIHLRRPPPVDAGPWQRLADRPVYFAAPRDEMVLDVEALQFERPAGPLSVRKALEESMDDYACQTAKGSLLEMASSAVLQELRTGINLEDMAERLHMTARTLHRALLRDGWSFSELIDIHRRYLAHDLLLDSPLSIAEVADQLGYSEVSSFTRAIRRWYGTTPSELRDGKGGQG
ncbi:MULTISPECIES: AraC family transcriptional regulator [unclassified Pseudomonas]|uniref:helix-turn-helix transcriptional regulator n=1 Tax=unclassified Pseudomonas TaxID=196821 RepID=UPI0014839C4A|nr:MULTISPECIES: AraC family transcriptional regulator [unclassified Pseudomonas]